ncbi:hypothetical protein [uncultured Fusobacterium sp.]|uniref:hypothetical protein n=1 Tax=uncultured Fusobacterium sp. TaxID=159267 RepID=UPI002592094D|nr:hypothetical protein [uncultured Fusobacterium sp.]
MGNRIKKFFLISAKNRKPYHLQNLKSRYKNRLIETKNLDEAELVLFIGKEPISISEKAEILKAKELGLQISYLTEELLPNTTLQVEMERLNKRHAIELKSELGFPGEEL